MKIILAELGDPKKIVANALARGWIKPAASAPLTESHFKHKDRYVRHLVGGKTSPPAARRYARSRYHAKRTT